MATYLVFHEVDDVDHWLKSPKRDELFGPRGIMHRTFYDPQGSKRVGLIVEIPDIDAFHELLQSGRPPKRWNATVCTPRPSCC